MKAIPTASLVLPGTIIIGLILPGRCHGNGNAGVMVMEMLLSVVMEMLGGVTPGLFYSGNVYLKGGGG